MGKFALGLLLGLVLGGGGTAFAALIVGETGYLSGWNVTKDGEQICSEPYVWTATHEIECD